MLYMSIAIHHSSIILGSLIILSHQKLICNYLFINRWPSYFVCHNNQGHCVLCPSCISNPTPEEWLVGWDVSQRQDHSSSSDYGNKENLTTWRYIYTEGRQRFQRVGKDATWKHRPWGDGLYLMDFLYHNWYSIMQIHVSECVLYVPCFPSENVLKGAIRDRFGIPSIAGSAASFCFTSIPSRKFTISHRNTF